MGGSQSWRSSTRSEVSKVEVNKVISYAEAEKEELTGSSGPLRDRSRRRLITVLASKS